MKKKKQKEFAKVINKTIHMVANSESHSEIGSKMRTLSRRERRLLLNEQKSRQKKEAKLKIDEEPIDEFAMAMQAKTLAMDPEDY